jgi:GH35 family endo-1,4-beta-xylanase
LTVVTLAAPFAAAQPDRQFLPISGGFDYTFDGLQQAVGASSIRLFDTTNGWGGAGEGLGTIDLRPYANGRWVVDFRTNPSNRIDRFGIELYDINGNSGTWTVPTWNAPSSVNQTWVTQPTLSQPEFGVNDFRNLDLSRITNFQILGQWQSPDPIDLTFTSVKLSVTAPAPPPYLGAEANAPWRAEAATRIDQIRKANFTVRVLDAAGNPVTNAPVRVEQTRHEFGFGSAVQGHRLRDNNPTHAAYKAKVAELFNIATVENDLKHQPWEGEWGPQFSPAGGIAALNWLGAQGIERRGHVMVWPGANNLPADLKALVSKPSLTATEQQTVRSRLLAHIASVGGSTNGKIDHWDVVNEPRTNHDVMDLLPEGDALMATWFQAARAANPTAKLYLNEYDILASGGNTNSPNQILLESQLRALLTAGAPIGGVGLQGHFNPGNLSGPTQMWQVLDRYDALGLPVQVTEFDFNTTDESLQAQFTRDFYTAMFAHEAVTDVLMWGFWEDAHWLRNAAMYRSDWSIKPNGQAFLDLVYNEWWTDETRATSGAGDAVVRAFKGSHSVSTVFGGAILSEDATLDADGEIVTLRLGFVVGDFNRDGAVDAADYTVWRDTLGQVVPFPGWGADADGDRVVGQGDLLAWRANYGDRAAASAAIPEPATGVLLGVLIGVARRRKSSQFMGNTAKVG